MGINISVAMTTYNGSKYIIEQLESIRTQEYPVDEVVIRDDRSSDNTVQLVKDYIKQYDLASWNIQINNTNMGFGDNFMNTVRECTGDLIFLADQDDVWYPNKVKELATFFTEHPDISCAASAYDVCNDLGEIINMKLRNHWQKDDGSFTSIDLSYFMNGSAVRGASMCFRRGILDSEPIFKIGAYGHDTLISLYAILKGEMVFFNKILFKYRIHDNNTSSVSLKKSSRFSAKKLATRLKSLEGAISVLSQLAGDSNLNEHDRKLLNHTLDFMKVRSNLICRLSIKHLLNTTLYIKSYRLASQHGFLGGCFTLFTDICFSIIFYRTDKAR